MVENDQIETVPSTLLTFGDLSTASSGELEGDAIPLFNGRVSFVAGGTMAQVTTGMRQPSGFLEWAALGAIASDNVRHFVRFINELVDGLLTSGNIAITNGLDYQTSDRNSESKLDRIGASLTVNQLGSIDLSGTTSSTPNTVDLPHVWTAPEYPVKEYEEAITEWETLDLQAIARLVFGANPKLPEELSIRWSKVNGYLKRAHDQLEEAQEQLRWGGSAGLFFHTHLDKSLKISFKWFDRIPDRVDKFADAAADLEEEQENLREILRKLAEEIKKWEQLIAQTSDPAKIAEYRKRIALAIALATKKARVLGERLGGKLTGHGPWRPPGRYRGFLGLIEPDPQFSLTNEPIPQFVEPGDPVAKDPLAELPSDWSRYDGGNLAFGPYGLAPGGDGRNSLGGRDGMAGLAGQAAGVHGLGTGITTTNGMLAGGVAGGSGGLLSGRGGYLPKRAFTPPQSILEAGTALEGKDGLLQGRLDGQPVAGAEDDAATMPGMVPPIASLGGLGGRNGQLSLGTRHSGLTVTRPAKPGAITAGRQVKARDDERRREVAASHSSQDGAAEAIPTLPDVVDRRVRGGQEQ